MAVNGPKSGGAPTAAAVAQGNAAQVNKSKAAAALAAGDYAKTSAAGAPSKEAASVSISPRAKELSLAKAAVDATPDIREDKVAEFKKKIASGEYKPDPAKIADGIAREAIKDELSKTPAVALE
jgi:negative regulator of flagellin synthesis FlgM